MGSYTLPHSQEVSMYSPKQQQCLRDLVVYKNTTVPGDFLVGMEKGGKFHKWQGNKFIEYSRKHYVLFHTNRVPAHFKRIDHFSEKDLQSVLYHICPDRSRLGAIPKSTRKNVVGSYHIHGTQGYVTFLVKVSKNKQIEIFRRDYPGYENDDIKFDSKPCKVINNTLNVFIGDSRYNGYDEIDDAKGTSILVQLPHNRYVFIQNKIKTFKLPGTITKFVGDHLDDDEPSPFGVDTKGNIYLFREDSEVVLQPDPLLKEDHPQLVYYGKRKIKGKNMQVVH